jgi:DNA-binding IclR family transcriptional regulator
MVGVPFPYQDGRLILAFNCGGHAKVHTAKKLAQYGMRLLELTRAVRRELG